MFSGSEPWNRHTTPIIAYGSFFGDRVRFYYYGIFGPRCTKTARRKKMSLLNKNTKIILGEDVSGIQSIVRNTLFLKKHRTIGIKTTSNQVHLGVNEGCSRNRQFKYSNTDVDDWLSRRGTAMIWWRFRRSVNCYILTKRVTALLNEWNKLVSKQNRPRTSADLS